MPTDLEIYRAANQVIKWKGEYAEFEAAARADNMSDKGDIEGQRVWKRILKAIKELRRHEPDQGEPVH